MHPVHEFQANFGQAEPAISSPPDSLTAAMTLHDADSTVRNLCLVWPDGRRAFFSYAYLVTGDLTVQDSINALLLSFGSHTVLLKGYHLANLFDALLEHMPKTITAIDPRYLIRQNTSDSIVIDITVKSN